MVWKWILMALAALALLAAAGCLLFGYVIFRMADRRGKKRRRPKPPKAGGDPIWQALYTNSLNNIDRVAAMPQEALTLTSRDGLKLAATLLPAEAQTRIGAAVVLVHGYRGSGIENMGMFVPYYHEHGFDILIPDNRAHGESEGRYIGFGALDAPDCVDWCKLLTERFGESEKIVLHGISMGGATVDTAAGEPDLPKQVCGVISDCAFSSCVDEFTHVLKGKSASPPRRLLPLANFWCKRLAKFDMMRASAAEAIRHSTLPFLFIHGERDSYVPTAMVYKLADACPDPDKVVWIVPTAKHFVSYLIDREGYEAHLDAFLKRLGFPPPPPRAAENKKTS